VKRTKQLKLYLSEWHRTGYASILLAVAYNQLYSSKKIPIAA